MLLVNAKKGPSKIHGLGLIAHEFIPEGTVIWEYAPQFDVAIPEADLGKLSAAAKEQVLYYAFLDKKSRTFILSSDDDRFTNHHETPNSYSEEHRSIALRDIQPGEEITADYREINMVSFSWKDQKFSKYVIKEDHQVATFAPFLFHGNELNAPFDTAFTELYRWRNYHDKTLPHLLPASPASL